jgi:acetyl esterase/lipase
MKFSQVALISALAFLLAGAFTLSTAIEPAKALPGSRDEIYKTIDEVPLPIHIFESVDHQAGDKRPAIVFFFGGGWNDGSPRQFEKQCAYLASRGMVAMTAEYRVKSRHGVKVVSCFSDAKSAIRWVRQNARRLGIDPDRIAAGGGSAGGHLAGALGTVSAFDEPTEDTSISAVPDALVLFNPVLVLGPVEGYEIKDPKRRKKLERLEQRTGVPPIQLSPYHNLDSDLPPTIIFHGRNDTTVPYATVKLFTEQAKKKGNKVELIGYEGKGHGFFNFRAQGNPSFTDTVKKMDAFLVSLGYLQDPDGVDAFVAEMND